MSPRHPSRGDPDRWGLPADLRTALEQMPPADRAVVILRDVLGWPSADVAELLDTSAPAVDDVPRAPDV